tara:strand:- start:9135 stop:9500 length:366 start_codon:yes stop_codon:yes gene_type:complete
MPALEPERQTARRTAARPTRLAAAGVLLVAAITGLTATADRRPMPAHPTERAAPVPSVRINLNTATAAELELLPRIGPALSARIVEDRRVNGPFRSVEDLDRVRGIGPRTILNIREHVTAE